MITEEIAREMMIKMETLKKNVLKRNSKKNRQKLHEYEAECLEKLKYFVHMRAAKYRNFSNYEDLTQEGLDALLKAIRTFKSSKKGSFFFWAGLFVNTRLVRSANSHSVIRYPMHVAKLVKPKKESKIPTLLDQQASPETKTENSEIASVIQEALKFLTPEEQEIVNMVYGLDGNKTFSISKTCEIKNISRNNCVGTLKKALEVLKEKIEL